MKTHLRDTRLRNNCGMDWPVCRRHRIDEQRCKTVGDIKDVTCKHCLRIAPKIYPWAYQKGGEA